ncbi:MAG: SCO family protein [Methylovirgula sp.]
MLGLAAVCLCVSLLAGCNESKFHSTDISGGLPSLAFTMTRAADGKEVTQADYRGRLVMLYFGYTFCPDICPTTLINVRDVLRNLGPDANHVRVLFVSVDPNRDTLPILADYVKNFGSHIEGLRATPDELARLARRYRFVYSVEPKTKDHPYEVTHSSTIYVFDGTGAARLLVSSLATAKPDIQGTTADLRRLLATTRPPSLLGRLGGMV